MEREFVEWLQTRLQTPTNVSIGIGDDAAVYAPSADSGGRSSDQVVTTDLLCEGIHFLWNDVTPQDIGRKALAVNLSDMAAMAAQPRAAVVSLLWPDDRPWELAKSLYEGLLHLAEQFRVDIIGGDTNRWSGELVVSVTLFGEAMPQGVLRRVGACPGDAILVTGQLGGSLVEHHLGFIPRVTEALQLHRDYRLHAGMDISDGLLLDLSRLIQASGVGAEIDCERVPVSDAAYEISRRSGQSALQHALTDGEDFELLIIVEPDEADRLMRDAPLSIPISNIGTIVKTEGLWSVDARGNRTAMKAEGYLH